MSLTATQWIKLITCWKIIDEKLKSYISNTHENIFKKVQLDLTTGNSGNTANIDYYVTLLNVWPYCNGTEGVRFYLVTCHHSNICFLKAVVSVYAMMSGYIS